MLQVNTLNFLSELSLNNERNWFQDHKADYESAKADALALIARIIPQLSEVDKAFASDTAAKKCLMRIYRDVRFSKNKQPYKNNFGIVFDLKQGKPWPGFYLHIQPGKSFLAAGYWAPAPQELKKIRQEIDYDASSFKEILQEITSDRRFSLDNSNALKTAPQGYEKNHPHIEWLRLKGYVLTRNITDEELLNPALVLTLKSDMYTLLPFITFLRTAIAD